MNAERDRAVVAAILGGCIASWQEFVIGYSDLIMKVLRQVLFVEDDDEIYGVYVDLLQALYDGKLREYQARSALSTWLVLVSRGYALDYLRHKRGRTRLPRGYERLSDFEKRVYRWHFVEGVSFDALTEVLDAGRNGVSGTDIAAAIDAIEEVIDPRTLRRLDRERIARNTGHASWREMEYFVHMRLARAQRLEESSGEAIRRMEAEETRERLETIRSRLPEDERKVVDLRFSEGLTAGEIARRIGWATPRRVYSLIESALRKFRKEMMASTEEPKDSAT